MNTPLNIDLRGVTATRHRMLVAALATLPESFNPVVADAAVVALDGSTGWPQRVNTAIDNGATGVIVVAPTAEASDITTATIPVVLATPWRHESIIDRIAPEFRRLGGPRVLSEARVGVASGDDFDDAQAGIAQVIEQLLGESLTVTDLVEGRGQRIVQAATESGSLVTISVTVRTDLIGGAELRVIHGPEGVRVWLPDAGNARPGRATVLNSDGARQLVTQFESSYRSALRRLHEAITQDAPVHDLDEYGSAVTPTHVPRETAATSLI